MSEEGPALRRELGLRDITLFAITCIVGTRWIAAAAHAGPGSVTLWLMGAVFFVVPLAIAVAALVVKYPGAGGLYLWTRGDFGPWHGFLAFWVYWMGMAVWFPSAAMFYGGAALHAVGISETRWHVLSISLVFIWIALGTNVVGMKIGKWTENIGGASAWLVTALFVALAAVAYLARGSATPLHIMPRWNWGTVSFWATIAYAMSGLELAGLMGAEIRDPERTFPRAGWIASGCITAFLRQRHHRAAGAASAVADRRAQRPGGCGRRSRPRHVGRRGWGRRSPCWWWRAAWGSSAESGPPSPACPSRPAPTVCCPPRSRASIRAGAPRMSPSSPWGWWPPSCSSRFSSATR